MCNWLKLHGENIYRILDVTPLQQSHLDKLTHGQVRSRLWMRYHSGQVTASHLYQAVYMYTDPHKPALSLVHSICYPETAEFITTATQYGCEHKRKAIDTSNLNNQLQLHQELIIVPVGFVVYLNKLVLVHHKTCKWNVCVVGLGF